MKPAVYSVQIREYQDQDLLGLVEIFYQTIHSVGLEFYTPAQVQAWAPLPPDYAGWQEKLQRWPPLVAERDGRVLGFIILTPDGEIESAYTHKDYQRQGIAGQLYQAVEAQARAAGMKRLALQASHFARGFFAQQGFRLLGEHHLERGNETLPVWRMEKHLS